MRRYTVLYDPEGIVESGLPLDRGPHECLVQTVLSWTDAPGLRPADLQQIALQLTGAARAVADDVRRAADLLPEEHRARALADIVLAEAERRLDLPVSGTVRCAKGRARLVRALYERLDRLTVAVPIRAR